VALVRESAASCRGTQSKRGLLHSSKASQRRREDDHTSSSTATLRIKTTNIQLEARMARKMEKSRIRGVSTLGNGPWAGPLSALSQAINRDQGEPEWFHGLTEIQF
jgi:hypothetical protein